MIVVHLDVLTVVGCQLSVGLDGAGLGMLASFWTTPELDLLHAEGVVKFYYCLRHGGGYSFSQGSGLMVDTVLMPRLGQERNGFGRVLSGGGRTWLPPGPRPLAGVVLETRRHVRRA